MKRLISIFSVVLITTIVLLLGCALQEGGMTVDVAHHPNYGTYPVYYGQVCADCCGEAVVQILLEYESRTVPTQMEIKVTADFNQSGRLSLNEISDYLGIYQQLPMTDWTIGSIYNHQHVADSLVDMITRGQLPVVPVNIDHLVVPIGFGYDVYDTVRELLVFDPATIGQDREHGILMKIKDYIPMMGNTIKDGHPAKFGITQNYFPFGSPESPDFADLDKNRPDEPIIFNPPPRDLMPIGTTLNDTLRFYADSALLCQFTDPENITTSYAEQFGNYYLDEIFPTSYQTWTPEIGKNSTVPSYHMYVVEVRTNDPGFEDALIGGVLLKYDNPDSVLSIVAFPFSENATIGKMTKEQMSDITMLARKNDKQSRIQAFVSPNYDGVGMPLFDMPLFEIETQCGKKIVNVVGHECVIIDDKIVKTERMLTEAELFGDDQQFDQENLPDNSTLSNYPNPFNPTTIISFSLSTSTHVSLEIFNILGQRVQVLTDEILPAGNHAVEFNASSDLPSGIYLARFKAGEEVSVRKMILSK